MGWVCRGGGGSCRGVVGHVEVGWGGSCRDGVGHSGWGGSCRGGVGHADVRWIMHCGSHKGGVGHSGVNHENNRIYSHLSPMQNDTNQCDKESL